MAGRAEKKRRGGQWCSTKQAEQTRLSPVFRVPRTGYHCRSVVTVLFIHGVVVHQCVSSLELWSPCLHAEDDTGSPPLCASILVFGLSECFWGWKWDRRDHAGPRQPVLLAGIRRVPSVARWWVPRFFFSFFSFSIAIFLRYGRVCGGCIIFSVFFFEAVEQVVCRVYI